MPNRDQYQIQQRNTAIRNTYFHYIQTGMSRMNAYAKTAQEYYLSEVRVRDIVARRA